MKLNLQQLDLNLLLVFDALMRERNLSRAAIHHRSQPASNALARLREQLDQPLFRRTAKGLEPTAAALTLYVPGARPCTSATGRPWLPGNLRSAHCAGPFA